MRNREREKERERERERAKQGDSKRVRKGGRRIIKKRENNLHDGT